MTNFYYFWYLVFSLFQRTFNENFHIRFHLKFVIKIFWETLRCDHSKLLQYIFKENFSVHFQFQFESIQSNKLGWIIIHYLGFCSFYWIKVTIFNIYKYHNQMQTMAKKIQLGNSFKFRKKRQIGPYDNKAKKVSFYSSRSWSDIAHF